MSNEDKRHEEDTKRVTRTNDNREFGGARRKHTAVGNTKTGDRTSNELGGNSQTRRMHNRSNRMNTRTSPNNSNTVNEETSTSSVGETTAGTSTYSSSSKEIKLKIPIGKKNMIIIPFIIVIVVLLALIILVTIIAAGVNDSTGVGYAATKNYYNPQCDDITILMVDETKNYELVNTKTVSLEEYVAGVVNAEVGNFNNSEMYKLFAIIARSYVLSHESNCTIEASTKEQSYIETTDESIIKAVKETEGKVILLDGELISFDYDDFTCIDKDSNYYTMLQKEQKLPVNWVNSSISRNSSNSDLLSCDGTLENDSNAEISKWGSFYLITEEKYSIEEVIKYYSDEEDITISSKYLDDGGVANLEIKDTSQAATLYERLDEFLEAHGHSMDSINSFVMENVEENGWGTRSGVVAAAISLINYLYDNFNLKLPYYWGGSYQTVGVNPAFGGETAVSISRNGNPYYHSGLDCSGFVSWAIRNGGYKIDRKTTYGFDVAFAHNSCDITDSDCIGRPGDLINSKSCHVQLIIAVDEKSNTYYIAEAGRGVVTTKWGMHQPNCDVGDTRIIDMDEFYNNSANVDNSH